MELTLDERTEAAAVELIERLDKKRLKWSMNAAIVGIYDDEKLRPYFSSNQSCHAGMSQLAGCSRVVNALMTGEGYATGRVLSEEVELWFIDYILNRSPYAETFITKDAVKAREQRYTVSSGDYPANHVAAGMVALRRLWEYTYVAAATYSLAKAGVNEDLAFLLAHLVSTGNNPTDGAATTWSACHNGHCSVNPAAMDWPCVKNFLGHKITKPTGKLSAGANYYGYDGMFGEVIGQSYYRYVAADFPYAKCRGDTTVNLNPFTAALVANVAINSVPYHKAIEVMAEWANTTLMEKIQHA